MYTMLKLTLFREFLFLALSFYKLICYNAYILKKGVKKYAARYS